MCKTPEQARQYQQAKCNADRLVHIEPPRPRTRWTLRDGDHPQPERDLRQHGDADEPVQNDGGASVNLRCHRFEQVSVRLLHSCHHVSPQCFDFLRAEKSAPRRHAVLALGNRRDEAAFLIRRERPQIECALRVRHPRPVAGRAIRRIDTRALLDLLGRKLLLRRSDCVVQYECASDQHPALPHDPLISISVRHQCKGPHGSAERNVGQAPPL